MRIGIAAAGSGGHVFPALAVAEALEAHGIHKDDIVFFGGNRMEATTIPRAGYRFVGVNIHGIRRSLSMDNVRLPAKVRSASRAIRFEIASSGIDAMIVFGGYVAGPAALAARKAGIPLVVHEANAVPGMANRLVAGRADLVLVAFEQALAKLRRGVVVGNPLRQAFEHFDRIARRGPARDRYGLSPTGPVLGVVGGSLGAAALNEMATAIAAIESRSFEILHLCGPTHADSLLAASADVPGWIVQPFEDDMPDFYAAIDLVVSRAGAITIAEIEETATPAIVVPLPAGQGYQAANAAELVDSGGAVVMSQDDMPAIIDRVLALMEDANARKLMAERAGGTGHRRAASTVASRTLELIDA